MLTRTALRSLLVAVTLALLAVALGRAFAGPLTANGTQPPLTFPFDPQSTCQSCHGGLDMGHNIRPWTTWSGSPMAQSGRDPLFWAALDVANHDLAGVGDLCLRCHAPAGWLAGRVEPPVGSVDGCSLFGNLDEVDNDFSGVECSHCHRMTVNPAPPPGQLPVYHENGQYWLEDESCPNGFTPCRLGNYDYSQGGIEPPHTWAFSQYHVDSDLCGNCHNVTNPARNLIDENGVDTGLLMPVERTYKEWQQSAFSQPGGGFATCQNCHMPDATYDPAYACVMQTNNRTGDLPIHQLVGGNAWLPTVLAGEYPLLALGSSFAASAAFATGTLQSAATVELTAPDAATAGGTLPITVRVTNLTGHKLPTGYPEGRRMWLDVVLRSAGGAVLWESGAWDPATGALAADPPPKVYEVKPGIWDLTGGSTCDTSDTGGDPLFHFVLNNCIALDNRIPPLGFAGGSDLETRPVGYVYPETTPGSGVLVSYDLTSYEVPVPAPLTGSVTVEATLRYQTASDEYVGFLRDEAVANGFPDDCIPRSAGAPTMSRGELLFDMWTRYGRSAPVAMASASAAVEVALFADDFESGDTAAWSLATP